MEKALVMGKGPCDGLGASVKRTVDMSVKQGKITNQAADDFVRWANTNDKTSKVKYIASEYSRTYFRIRSSTCQ